MTQTQNVALKTSHKSRLLYGLIKHQLAAHSLLIITCVSFFCIALGTKIFLGESIGLSAWAYLSPIITAIIPITFSCVGTGILFYFIFIKRPANPAKEMIRIFYNLILDPRRWAKAIPAIGIMMLGFMAYTEMKPLIPILNPYDWDMRLAEVDRLLHFGRDPWEWLFPLFGSAIPTAFINFTYNAWFFIMFAFWTASAFTKTDRGWERQFLLSFIWTWMIGGIVLAVYFTSMGPAFYDLVEPNNNPFALQIEQLKLIRQEGWVPALATQDLLRESYLNPDSHNLSGISAMPSMHNATSIIFMLAAFRIHRIFGWVMAVFLAIIIIGSVHLAWHYAIDAYAGLAIGGFMWWAAGKSIVWQDKWLERRADATH